MRMRQTHRYADETAQVRELPKMLIHEHRVYAFVSAISMHDGTTMHDCSQCSSAGNAAQSRDCLS